MLPVISPTAADISSSPHREQQGAYPDTRGLTAVTWDLAQSVSNCGTGATTHHHTTATITRDGTHGDTTTRCPANKNIALRKKKPLKKSWVAAVVAARPRSARHVCWAWNFSSKCCRVVWLRWPGGRDSNTTRPAWWTLSELINNKARWRKRATCSASVQDSEIIPSQGCCPGSPGGCPVCHTAMVCLCQPHPVVLPTLLCQTCGRSYGVTSQSKLSLFGILFSLVSVYSIDWISIIPPCWNLSNFIPLLTAKSISAQSLCKSAGERCSLNTSGNIWPDLLKLQIFAAVLAGGSSFQDGQPDTSHLRYLQLITFLTFYKIHKPLLGRTDTTSKSQEIEFSGVEFVEFNQVVKYLSVEEGGGRGGNNLPRL